MQIHTIAKSIGKFAAFTAVAVFLSACVAADWGCWYPPGCAPRSGPPKPQLTPREAAQFQAQELYQQAKVHISKARYRQAERVLKGSIRIFENALGREAPEPLGPLTTLTNLYIHTDRSAEAVKLLLKRPRIRETVLGRLNRYPGGGGGGVITRNGMKQGQRSRLNSTWRRRRSMNERCKSKKNRTGQNTAIWSQY